MVATEVCCSGADSALAVANTGASSTFVTVTAKAFVEDRPVWSCAFSTTS